MDGCRRSSERRGGLKPQRLPSQSIAQHMEAISSCSPTCLAVLRASMPGSAAAILRNRALMLKLQGGAGARTV